MVAPRVFISYSHDSPEHLDKVLEFGNRLRRDGIDSILDQYEESPSEGWPRWMDKNIRKADFVLMVCTEAYNRRIIGEEKPGLGHGVIWEGHLIYQHIYNAGTLNSKFIPVLLEPGDTSNIPPLLEGCTYYRVYKEEDYKKLTRRLLNLPRPVKERLGEPLPFRERKQDFFIPWNIPRHNPFFTGREKILEELRYVLSKENSVALTQPQAISGLGGIGKTQTAIQYAYLNRDNYKAVFWINAGSYLALILSFVSIAKILNLPEKDENDNKLILEAVRNWLDKKSNWLLIFDGADHPEIVKPFLPRQQNGHILLTSRAQTFQSLGISRPLELKEMLPDEALKFLIGRTGRNKMNISEKQAAEDLAKELGYLPLALEQAAAFISVKQSRFQDYLRSFRFRHLELLHRNKPQEGNYPLSVATTWSMNFEEIEKSSKIAADILCFSVFVGPDNIPIELLIKGASQLGFNIFAALMYVDHDPVRLDEHLEKLTRYSLITRDLNSNSYSIHQLVQEVVRDRLLKKNKKFYMFFAKIFGRSKYEYYIWAKRTVRAVNQAFPSPTKFHNWVLCDRLLPHAETAAKYAQELNLASQEIARLLHELGIYFHERKLNTEAELFLKRSYDMLQRILGTKHHRIATNMRSLALLYEEQDKYEEAEQILIRSLEITEKSLGPQHPDVALALNNLASLYSGQGRYSEAEVLYKRSLGIKEEVFGFEHPSTSTSLNNLASLYHEQGKNLEAELLYKRALDIDEKILGPDHPVVASRLNNLGMLYYDQGKLEEAELFFKRSIDISEKILGPELPNLASTIHHLAVLYRDRENYREAERLFNRSLEIREKVLGAEHPDVAAILYNFGRLYYDENKYSEAQQLFERSLDIIEKSFGEVHTDTMKAIEGLGAAYYKQKKYSQAEILFKRNLAICEKLYGKEHPLITKAIENLAAVYYEQQKYEDAEPLFKRNLELCEKLGGKDHPNVAVVLENYVPLLRKTNRNVEAEKLYARAQTIHKEHQPIRT